MKRSILVVIGVAIIALVLTNILHDEVYYNLQLEELKQEYAIKPISSVDHAKFEELQKDF